MLQYEVAKKFHMHNNRSKLCKTKQKKRIATFIEASLTNEMYYRQTYSWSKKKCIKALWKISENSTIWNIPIPTFWVMVSCHRNMQFRHQVDFLK